MFETCIILAIFLLGNLTIFFCCFSLKIIYKNAYLHNAFGYICGAKSIAELFIGACFGFWAAPIAFFNPNLSQSNFGFIVGHILIFSDFLTIFLHFCKSLNRFHAIIFPIHYLTKFTSKVGLILCFSMVLLSFGFSSFLFAFNCNYYFNGFTFLWNGRTQECPGMSYFYYSSVFVTVIGCGICDSVTFVYIIVFQNRIQKLQQKNSQKFIQKRFFIQTCLTTILYIFMMICFNLLTKLATSLTVIVLCTTIAWILFHMLHQLVFIVFSVKMKNISTIKISTASKFLTSNVGITRIVA